MWKTLIGAFLGALAACIAFFGTLAMIVWRWMNTPLGERMRLVTPTPSPFQTPTPTAKTAFSPLLDPGYTWLWATAIVVFTLCVIVLIWEVHGIRVKKCPPS